MENKYCKNSDCGNIAISFSDYCGKHSNSRMVKKKLKDHKEKEFSHLDLSGLHLKDFNLKGKVFDRAKFDSCEFSFIVFEDCEFDLTNFVHLTFDDCRFENCMFVKFEANDVTWMNCHFIGCSFKEGQFSQSSFDSTNFIHSKFETTEFNGHLFIDIKRIDFCTFELCLFIQVSFSRIHMFATVLDNSDLNKTSLHDSYFINCDFKDSSNDFKQSGPPMLCHFNDTRFTNFYIPRSAKRWNNYKLTPKGFYHRIVNMILNLSEQAEDSLNELTLVLKHLEELNFKPSLTFNQRINELFSRLIQQNARIANYQGVGRVINEYGKIPDRYRNKSSFFLPPPESAKPVVIKYSAKMTLQVELQEWKTQKVSRLFNLLANLEMQIPGKKNQVLNRLEQGSLIAVFWGDIKQFLYTGRLLDVEKLELDIEKGEADLLKTHLEIKAKEIELDSLREDKELEREAKRQMLEAQRLTMLSQKLDLLERLERRNGVDPVAFGQTPEGQAATQIAAQIRQEFPIISVRIEENTDNGE